MGAEGLKLSGVYYEGFVTDGTPQKHRLDAISTFSIRKSRKTVAGQHHTNSNYLLVIVPTFVMPYSITLNPRMTPGCTTQRFA